MIARVAVFVPVEKSFDYRVPEGMPVTRGARVWVPYGGRSVEGVVLQLDPPDSPPKLRALSRLVEAAPLPSDLLELAEWMAEYYLAPIGEVLRGMVPAGGRARAKKKIILTNAGEKLAESLRAALEPVEAAELSPRERAVLAALRDRVPFDDPAALKAIVAKGLAAVEEEVHTKHAREEQIFRVVQPVAPPELARAPRRAQVYKRILEAGEISLSELRKDDARAGEHAQALVEAGLISVEKREIARDPFADLHVDHAPPPALTMEQAGALGAIVPAIQRGDYVPFLLHGVTGSGKTEVYLRAIAAALEQGKRALVLVPEISLTPQLASRFRARFGANLAVLHSGLGDAERQDAHRRIARGQVSIVVGARSAAFAPLEPLGLVVVDEEHDSSFKQEEGVRYHGRDVVLRRARAASAVAILGSATPSIETLAAARDGRLTLLELPERATPRPLPTVEILDLKKFRADGGVLTAPLQRALEETLAAGEQAILFLNRRGFSTFLLCKACGQGLRCRDCSVTLTYHRAVDRLICHYCGYNLTPPPRRCPTCGAGEIERLGFGTEQVETRVRELLPRARVGRLDRDTAQGRGLQAILDGLRRRELDVVVGTQMITKGHDFPGVTLVGVVLADSGMGLPDFRAAERTFQLLVQVAGRAGRGERAGRVLIQTFNPQHPAIACARDHDYARFVEGELASRKDPPFPPTVRLACVRVDGADPQVVREVAEAAAQAARAMTARAPVEENAGVLGPAEAPLSRLKGRTRWHLFLRAKSARALRTIARSAMQVAAPRGTRVTVDVDPISML